MLSVVRFFVYLFFGYVLDIVFGLGMRVVKFRVHDGSEQSGDMRVVIRVGWIWRHFPLLYIYILGSHALRIQVNRKKEKKNTYSAGIIEMFA